MKASSTVKICYIVVRRKRHEKRGKTSKETTLLHFFQTTMKIEYYVLLSDIKWKIHIQQQPLTTQISTFRWWRFWTYPLLGNQCNGNNGNTLCFPAHSSRWDCLEINVEFYFFIEDDISSIVLGFLNPMLQLWSTDVTAFCMQLKTVRIGNNIPWYRGRRREMEKSSFFRWT